MSGCCSLDAKVKVTKEGVLIPEELFKEMLSTYVKMEQKVETLETLADKEALKTIEQSKRQMAKGKFAECSTKELAKILK